MNSGADRGTEPTPGYILPLDSEYICRASALSKHHSPTCVLPCWQQYSSSLVSRTSLYSVLVSLLVIKLVRYSTCFVATVGKVGLRPGSREETLEEIWGDFFGSLLEVIKPLS